MMMDLSQPDIRDTIIQRLKLYLSRDKTGIRHTVLDILLRERSITSYELYTYIYSRYGITHKQAISMLGVISSKLGIISAKRESYSKAYVYILREKYRQEINQVLSHQKYSSSPSLIHT
jgi:hypothetical protein